MGQGRNDMIFHRGLRNYFLVKNVIAYEKGLGLGRIKNIHNTQKKDPLLWIILKNILNSQLYYIAFTKRGIKNYLLFGGLKD